MPSIGIRRNALPGAKRKTARSGRIDGALNDHRFYTVRDLPDAPSAFFFHRVGRSRIYAGVFDMRALPNGARVVSARPDYWDASRSGGAFVVVDAPALEHSSIALRVAPHMDGVVLVVGSGRGAAPAAMEAREHLLETGANLIGLVYAGADAPAVAIDRLLRHAG